MIDAEKFHATGQAKTVFADGQSLFGKKDAHDVRGVGLQSGRRLSDSFAVFLLVTISRMLFSLLLFF